MRYVFYVFWIFVILLGLTFTALNSQKITLNYYLDTQTIYLPLLILVVLLIGVMLGVIAMLPSLIKNKQAARRLKFQVRRIEREVQNLRKIPIKDVVH